jgi:hypothetical protein
MTINRLNQDVTYLPAFRNLIINGAMQVAQRATSTASIITSGYYTADRFATVLNSLGTWTQSVENDAPTGSGFAKSLKMLCTTADAAPAGDDQIRIEQLIEGQNLQAIRKGTANAQQLSLQFWVKSNVTGTYTASLTDTDNSRSVSASYSVASSGTWEKKTIVFPADTTGVLNNDNGTSIALRFWLGVGTDRSSGTLQTSWGSTVNANLAVGQTNLAAATNNYWQVTGVQLEVGAVATPFEFKPIEQELAECQRYFQVFSTNTGWVAFGAGRSGSAVTLYTHSLMTTMRARPTYSLTSSLDAKLLNGSAVGLATTVGSNPSTENTGGLELSRSSGTWSAETTSFLELSGSGRISYSAEL